MGAAILFQKAYVATGNPTSTLTSVLLCLLNVRKMTFSDSVHLKIMWITPG